MRVTTFGMTNNYLSDINSIQERMNLSEQQLTTGRKINKPSDDPVGTVLDMQLHITMSNIMQWQQNLSDAQTFLNNTEGALTNVDDNLQSVRTLLIEGNNSTLNADDRSNIAANIDQIRSSIEQLANTKISDQYIFAGNNTTVSPLTFTTAGGVTTYSWNGNSNAINYSIGIGNQIQVNTDGSKIFMTPPAGTTVGLLDALKQASTDLKNPSVTTTQLSQDLGNIDAHLKNVIAARADVGARENRITALQNQFSQNITSLQTRISNVEDANMADVITQFRNQQTVYQAALDTGQKMILPTLADYLK